MDYCSVNGILRTGYPHMSIAVIRVGLRIDTLQTVPSDIACRFLNKLPLIVIAVNFKVQQLKGIQVEDTHVVLTPIGADRKIAAISAQKAFLLRQIG